nr:hypothetical protein [Pseudobdellovibrionaceae bacterium]
KSFNGCIPLLAVSKDGFTTLAGTVQEIKQTQCKSENYEGARGLTFQLKKINRTISEEIKPISLDQSCEIYGRVVDEKGQGIEGATVKNGSLIVQTDAMGIYHIQKQEHCDRFCHSLKEGYRSQLTTSGMVALSSCFEAQPADMVLIKEIY